MTDQNEPREDERIQNEPAEQEAESREQDTRTATKPAPTRKPTPNRPTPSLLPRWRVLLHNDDVNDMLHVVQSIVALTPLSHTAAVQRMLEAHQTGVALLLVTHQELAELYRDQFTSKQLTVTIEPEKD